MCLQRSLSATGCFPADAVLQEWVPQMSRRLAGNATGKMMHPTSLRSPSQALGSSELGEAGRPAQDTHSAVAVGQASWTGFTAEPLHAYGPELLCSRRARDLYPESILNSTGLHATCPRSTQAAY